MGDLINVEFGKRDRDENEAIAACPVCDCNCWLIILNQFEHKDQKIMAYECDACGWRVEIHPIKVGYGA